MIGQLEQLLTANKHQEALSLVSSPPFFQLIHSDDLKRLIHLVETTAKTQTYPPSIFIAIYSIIVMKTYKSNHNNQVTFNYKLTIEALTKLYNDRDMSVSNKEIIACLLLRLPNFTNYRLVAKNITPKYVPEKMLLTANLGDSIKKQVPSVFQQKWKQFKCQWPNCSPHVLSRDLAKDFQQFSKYFKDLLQLSQDQSAPTKQLNSLALSIKRQYKFILQRINKMRQTDRTLDIDAFLKSLKQIIATPLLPEQSSYSLSMQIKQLIINSQNLCLKILNQFIKTLGKRLLRRVKLIYGIISEGFNHRQLKTDLIDYTNLLRSYLSVFGEGFLQPKRILYNGDCSVEKLIETLLNSKFEEKRQEQINFQRGKNKQPPSTSKGGSQDTKSKQQSILKINTRFEGHFQIYLKSHSKEYRDRLLGNCLLILIKFYSNSSYQSAHHFLSIIDNAKNRISPTNSLLCKQLKQVLFRDSVQFKPGFEYFCEQVFRNSLKSKEKERTEKQFTFMRSANICINPITFLNQIPRNPQRRQIKKTKSIEMEGWEVPHEANSVHKSKESKENSQMFYSIKQCSVVEQLDHMGNSGAASINNRIAEQTLNGQKEAEKKEGNNQGSQGEDFYLLTPQF